MNSSIGTDLNMEYVKEAPRGWSCQGYSSTTNSRKHPKDYKPPRILVQDSSPHPRYDQWIQSRSVSCFAKKQRGVRRVMDRSTHHSRRNQVRDQISHGKLEGVESVNSASSAKGSSWHGIWHRSSDYGRQIKS